MDRQWVAFADDGIHPGCGGDQLAQRREGCHPDAGRAEFLEHGAIADELDDIAETLLGMHQDRLALQRFALPLREWKHRELERGLEVVGIRDARFVQGPAFVHPAHAQQQQAQIEAGIAKIRVDAQRLAQDALGLLGAVAHVQHQGQAQVQRQVFGAPALACQQQACGAVLILQPQVQGGHLPGGADGRRVQPVCVGICRQRIFQALFAFVQHAQVVPSLDVAGVDLQRLAHRRLCLFAAAAAAERAGEVVERMRIARLQFQRLCIGLRRCPGLADSEQGTAQQGERRGARM